MEKHTVECTFDGELVSSVTDESGILTLYRTPEDTYFVHIDMRHVAEDVAPDDARNAVLEVGCSPKGLPEDIIRAWFPKLLAPQSAQ
jgi:hypothetical protein